MKFNKVLISFVMILIYCD